jgi:hypothetical protein
MTEDVTNPGQPRAPRLPPYIADHRDEPAEAAAADSEVSPLRPFVLTSGRAESIDETLELEAQVETTEFGLRSYSHLAFERRDIVALCTMTMSVAEIGAKLGLQIGVVRVLAADLAAAGHIVISRPSSQLNQDLDLIERVIRGFEAIH